MPDTGAKMPPGGHRRPHKRRNVRGEYRDIAVRSGRPEGRKKARPGVGRVVVLQFDGPINAQEWLTVCASADALTI